MVAPLRPLDRKLLRDLWRIRGQVLAIALVIASGVAVMLMSLSSIDALQNTARAYYERYRFAEVFVSLKRAPESVAERVAALPGVQVAETRVVEFASLSPPGFDEPVNGLLVSVPEEGDSLLNGLALRAGRWVEAGHPDQAIMSEPFAEAHGLTTGDRIRAVINGHERNLEIVGIALSPEYVYTIGPGQLLPDNRRFGVLWMGQEALRAAYNFEGAFNSLSLTLLRGSNTLEIIDRLDRLLAPYGGTGAIERADQLSNWFLMSDIQQLRTMAAILPSIFLAVAAFLANMVITRLITTERGEIGLMKAFGYSNVEVGWHYTKMVLVLTGIGILIGWGLGFWLGRLNTQLYAEYYRFPFLFFRSDLSSLATAGSISLAAALFGTLNAVGRAVRLPPAEAMRPPAPPHYQKLRLGVDWLGRLSDASTRIILRQITRWPLRSFLTASGVAMAVAVLITSMQWLDSIDHIVVTALEEGQRQDVTIGLIDSQDSSILGNLAALPGVMSVEPARGVSVRFRNGLNVHRGSIEGVIEEPRLNRVYDVAGLALRMTSSGLVLSTKLAEILNVGLGDSVMVEVLEGRRPRVRVPVVQLFETYLGTPAYMRLDALNHLLHEPRSVDQAQLLVDPAAQAALFARLKTLPVVASVALRRAAVKSFRETVAETILMFITFFTGFACALAFGVVYNSVSIALSERGRELATLRVLGFSRWEISYILLGEVAFLILLGLPLGCLAGLGLAWVMTSSFETELYRVPLLIEPSTYGYAMLITLAAAAGSALFVGRRLAGLDLVAVLKTRE